MCDSSISSKIAANRMIASIEALNAAMGIPKKLPEIREEDILQILERSIVPLWIGAS